MATLVLAPLVACGPTADAPVEAPIARSSPTVAEPNVRASDGEEGVFDPRGRGTAPAGGAAEEPRPAVVVCPNGARWDGSVCVVTEVECPSHSKLVGSRCVGEVRCPDDSAWDGSGCRPFSKLAPSPPPGSAPPPSPASASGPCSVSFNAIPTADLFLDGAAMGSTPRIHAPVAAGRHIVLFVSSTHGRKSVAFDCRSGETKFVVVKLTD